MYVTDITIRVKSKRIFGLSGDVKQVMEVLNNKNHACAVKTFEFVDNYNNSTCDACGNGFDSLFEGSVGVDNEICDGCLGEAINQQKG